MLIISGVALHLGFGWTALSLFFKPSPPFGPQALAVKMYWKECGRGVCVLTFDDYNRERRGKSVWSASENAKGISEIY